MDKRITRKQFEQALKTLDRNQAKYAQIDSAFGRGELTEEQARTQMDAMIDGNNAAMAICAEYKHQQASIAARALRAIPSEKRSAQSRINGKFGGRPRKPE